MLRFKRTQPSFLKPSWVLPFNPGLDIDFMRNRAWNGTSVVTPDTLVQETRTGQAWVDDVAGSTNGQWYSFAANQLRFTNYGTIAEETRTNSCLWCRDLTNAVWVKSSTTAALTQTGLDNVPNSCSLLTATGANGTCLQTITQASSAVLQSVWVKRITGAGTVNMTTDGGTTWTVITVTANWGRQTIPVQTLVNPVVGFRLVTSGDAVAIDFVGNEVGGTTTLRTSPILTTTAAATRGGSVIKLKYPPGFGSAFTIYAACKANAPNAYAQDQFILAVSDGTALNRFAIKRTTTTSIPAWVINSTATAIGASVIGQNTTSRTMASYSPGSQAGTFGTPAIQNTATGADATTFTGLNTIEIGGAGIGGDTTPFDGYIHRITIWPNYQIPLTSMTDIARMPQGF